MPLSLECCSVMIWPFFIVCGKVCVWECVLFFPSAFSLNAQGLSQTKNFLSFQRIEFVVKMIWSRNKDGGDVDIKVTLEKIIRKKK